MMIVASAAAIAQEKLEGKSDGPPETARAESALLLQPPTLTITQPAVGRQFADQQRVEFVGTARGDNGISRVIFTIRGPGASNEITLWLNTQAVDPVPWNIVLNFICGANEVNITAVDTLGNRTAEAQQRLIILPWNYGNEPVGFQVGFISPLQISCETVPNGVFSGAIVYAFTMDGTPITAVTYEVLLATTDPVTKEYLSVTTDQGDAVLRGDGDWQIPPSTLTPGNTTIKVSAYAADGRVAHGWLELMTPETSSATTVSNATNNSSAGGVCGNGSGFLAFALLSLALFRLRRQHSE